MKKPLLLGISVMLGITTLSAQGKFRKAPSTATAKKAVNFAPARVDGATSAQFGISKGKSLAFNNAKSSVAPPYKKISSSYNVLTAIVSESNCLSYNKDLGAVAFVHRQSPTLGNAGANSGNTQITYTSNWGTTWDSLAFGLQTGGSAYRYPSGAIYNPAGNTTVANAFAVGSGPITTGAGWVGNYYVSGQLNGTNLSATDHYAGAGAWPTHFFARNGFDIAGGNAYVASMLTDDENYTNYRGTLINKGTFNTGTNTFDWTWDSIKPNVVPDAAGDLQMGVGNLAWSENGQIGYVIHIGVDANATTPETRTYNPIVHKTTDGGMTWSQYMPNFDFLTAMVNAGYGYNLYSYDGVNAKPYFTTINGIDYTVDKNGDLHIAAQITSGYSDHPDSLGYYFAGITQYIYDVYTHPTDGYHVELIDSIFAPPSDGANDGNHLWEDVSAGTPYDNDARLQISRNENGTKLFFVWVDSDMNNFTSNIAPYLCWKGVDVDSRCWTPKDSLFASGDGAYYHYLSPVTKGNSGTYNIPVTYVLSADGSYNAVAKVDHYFVDDMMSTDADFTICTLGAEETIAMLSAVSVYPNPFSNSATLSVKLREANTVKVNVYNALGQIVISKSVNAVAGVNKINLAAENLSSGVYFYEVKAGDYSVTDKMMIQK